MVSKSKSKKNSIAAEAYNLPPQNIEAEKCILGSILLESKSILEIIEKLEPDDFYHEAHRIIYKTMVTLFNRSQPQDIIAVTNALRDSNKLEDVGGLAYVASFTDIVPMPSNTSHYINIILEKSILRQLISASSKINAGCYEKQGNVSNILDEAESAIFAISNSRSQSAYKSVNEFVKISIEKVEELSKNNDPITGVPTGFESFDALTAGLQPANLIIIAARPSMGKTALAMNIAQNAAIKSKIPVGVFSLEMSGNELAMRMLCSVGHVDLRKVRSGQLNSESDWARLVRAINMLESAPIYIDETPAISILELRAKARRMKIEHNIGLVIVDYLQLMRGPQHVQTREQEVSEISRSLKALAKEIDVPVIALSQLNRAMETRKNNKRPQLSDLRDSGAIEQDADVVCFIHREEIENPDPNFPKRGISELIIGKQRNGPTGSVRLTFLKEYTSFENLAWQ
ncbi:MAG: replicative DNA helicase [Deltaproteobacteria bacterium]|jgi:replicative DNA helicase|nr:replicative DNA helicase [Deltaproteobacteria bacterium]